MATLEGRVINGFTLGKEIGHGAFSHVYLTESAQTDPICCKVIARSSMDDQVQAEVFTTEVNALMILNHPSILSLCDLASDNENFYMFMRYYPEGSLQDLIKRNTYLDEKHAQSIFSSLMTALQYCHSRNIAHRDIKPGNVLISGKTAILADFGISSFSIEYTSKAGTIPYMAPEFFSGEPIDGKKADIWSCGIVLYEMLTGKRPWNATHNRDLINQIRNSPLTFPPRVSQAARSLISDMLEKSPGKRASSQDVLTNPWLLNARKSQIRASQSAKVMITNTWSSPDLSSHFATVVGQAARVIKPKLVAPLPKRMSVDAGRPPTATDQRKRLQRIVAKKL